MTNILATSEKELDSISQLLEKKIPTYRQAYSDRTAWVMACMSELAYIKFNPLLNDRKKAMLFDRVSTILKENDSKLLTKILDSLSYDHEQEKKNLEETLDCIDMVLLKTFDHNGSQAILVMSRKTNMLVLAFRGTEADSFTDIKADANGKVTACDSGGNVHSGFKKAYEEISLTIESEINDEKYSGIPLFITGHSLGGALATIAAKKLKHKAGVAACYTYGSPRVGDEEWIRNIKTPIYRLVNAADSVTMLPPGGDTLLLIAWLIKFIPYVGKPLREWLMSNFNGYMHCGNMRYLTNCKNAQYENVKLFYSVSFFYRIKGVIFKNVPWKKLLADHSISVYRKKTSFIAQRRNNIK